MNRLRTVGSKPTCAGKSGYSDQTPDARPGSDPLSHLNPPPSLVALRDMEELGSWLSLAKSLSKALMPNEPSSLWGPALKGLVFSK